MARSRRLMLELMEERRLLAVVGPFDPANSPAWQSVIVELKSDSSSPNLAAQALLNPSSGRLDYTYGHAVNGFSARLPRNSLDTLRNNPLVARVELDIEMIAFAQTLPTGVNRIEADSPGLSAPIDGLDERVDVDIAIIDSGIAAHPDLNIAGGFNATGGSTANWSDGYGHGTHVAGIAAALDNGIGVVGVAPGARLWAVKVLGNNGTGSLSNIIRGIDWVTANANQIEIANMSLGGQGVSAIYRAAIQRSVAAGVVYIAAAGNEYRDILGGSSATASPVDTISDTIPAAYPEVATISAFADSDGQPGGFGPSASGYADDTFADFSNFSNSGASGASWYTANNLVNNPKGLGIDLVLPGVNILSTYKGGGYATMSGTSMAAPHAAGLAARYIAANGRANDAAGVYAIRQALIDGAKEWRDPNYGLQFTLPGNSDSPDNFEEKIGWAGPSGPINQPPVAAADNYSVDEDSSLTIDITAGLLSNDSDAENDPLSLVLVSNVTQGTLTLTSDGSFSYAPVANFYGADSFTYRAQDGTSASNIATVSITVNSINDAPVASNQSVSLFQNSSQAIVLSGSDIDGDPLVYSFASPAHGALNGTGANLLYTPDPNYVGPDSFTLSVSDGTLSSQGTVTIEVLVAPSEVELFADSFENGPSNNSNNWNGRWVEDSQNDFFRSTQQATAGARSAEVDGSAIDATLTLSNSIDMTGYVGGELTFDWLIENGFDSGEFLALDILKQDGSWDSDVRRLRGNVDTENVWHSETVDLAPYLSANLKIRFRCTVSASDEDANIDNVKLVGLNNSVNSAGLLSAPPIASLVKNEPLVPLSSSAFGQSSEHNALPRIDLRQPSIATKSEVLTMAEPPTRLSPEAIDEVLTSDIGLFDFLSDLL